MVEVAAVFLLTRQSEPQDVVGQTETETRFAVCNWDLTPSYAAFLEASDCYNIVKYLRQ